MILGMKARMERKNNFVPQLSEGLWAPDSGGPLKLSRVYHLSRSKLYTMLVSRWPLQSISESSSGCLVLQLCSQCTWCCWSSERGCGSHQWSPGCSEGCVCLRSWEGEAFGQRAESRENPGVGFSCISEMLSV